MFDPAYWAHRWCQKSLVTFGAPRTLNYELACWLNKEPLRHNLRVQAEGDPANSYPSQVHGHFWHCGRLVLLRHVDGAWRVTEHADVSTDDVAPWRGMVEYISLPLLVFDILSPTIASVMGSVLGIALDAPANVVNMHTHFSSYKEAFSQAGEVPPNSPNGDEEVSEGQCAVSDLDL